MNLRLLYAFLVVYSLIGITVGQDALAQGSDKERAKEYYERGKELIEEQEYDKAVVELQRAYDISPNFWVLYNLGKAAIGAGDFVLAVDALSRFLEDGGNQVPLDLQHEVRKEIETQKARIAYLNVEVNINNALVNLDGKKIGTTPLYKNVPISSGYHTVTVSREGYQTEEQKVTVAGKDRRTLHFTLRSLAAASTEDKGQLVVTCDVPNVSILVDQDDVAKTPMDAPLLVAVGRREISCIRKDYTTITREVEIIAGELTKINCDIQPSPGLGYTDRSTIDFNVTEEGAAIYVDGKVYDNDRLPTGRHHIEVRRSGFEPWTRSVELSKGETVTLNVELVPLEDYRHDYESNANTIRTLSYIIGAGGIVLGAVSLGLYLYNDSEFKDWQNEYDALEYDASQPLDPDLQADLLKRQEKNSEKLDAIHDMDAVTVGIAIAGGALLTTGIILFFAGDDPDKYEGLSVGIDSDEASVGFRFLW